MQDCYRVATSYLVTMLSLGDAHEVCMMMSLGCSPPEAVSQLAPGQQAALQSMHLPSHYVVQDPQVSQCGGCIVDSVCSRACSCLAIALYSILRSVSVVI